MNANFTNAFQEEFPFLRVVYDYFHIVKNFNDKVIGELRKDEYDRLVKGGDVKAASSLKRSRYILTSSRETLRRKDEEAAAEKAIRKGK